MEVSIYRGDDIYNNKLNKMAVALDASDQNRIKVRSVSGEEVWDSKDCTIKTES